MAKTIGKYWVIEDDNSITHLHEDGNNGKAKQFGPRLACGSCKNSVPDLVKTTANNGGTNSTMAARKTTRKANAEATESNTITVDDAMKVLASNPEAMARFQSENSSQAGELQIPSYTHETGAVLYFESKPSDECRRILKDAKFIWQNRLENGSVKGAWIGPAANLVGTPFEIK